LTEELMLTFVVTDESVKNEIKAMILRLRQKEHILVSVFLNINTERTNTIFGSENKKVLGADGLRESLCDLHFEIGPTSFFQVNPWQAATIYRRVEQMAGASQGSEVAWDLYCGTGQISLLLAKQSYRTLGIEENPLAIADAEANVVRNELDADQKPYYIAGRVEDIVTDFPLWAQKPSVIVANPSRRGLAANARHLIVQGLQARDDARFLYVSCEAETMVRDLQELVALTGRKVRQLECYDMFPFTGKLEWIAVLQ
jgi:23S rRNA (uracil1939-C5)-methyltransferase